MHVANALLSMKQSLKTVALFIIVKIKVSQCYSIYNIVG